ncbi:MAG: hypothetical protein M3081_10370 [Gemmatimonadota bacterium]|nr:hypothetical protein [Gemmatimonadota bacterium]
MKRATNVFLLMLAVIVLLGLVMADVLVMFPRAFDGMMVAMGHLHIGAAISVLAAVAAQLRALPRSAWLATGGTLLAAVTAAAVVLIARRLRGGGFIRRSVRRAPIETKAGAKVLSLATRGESRAEIARHTGLSQDAVRMLLESVTERAADRQIHPGAA